MSEQNGLNPFLNSRRNAGILAIFALVTTLAIALTFTLTKDTIAEQKQAKLLAVIFDVVNRDKIANDIQDNCLVLPDVAALGNKTDLKAYRGYNEAGKLTSVAMQSVAPNGYSGDIRFLVGLASDFSTITGVRVLEHQETPGLGDKIDLRISDWILDFTNTTATTENVKAWAVKKEGGQFDAFTGATITPRALVQAIHKTALYAQNNAEFIRTATNVCAEETY
jgi:electron transport complex protein RnfG